MKVENKVATNWAFEILKALNLITNVHRGSLKNRYEEVREKSAERNIADGSRSVD
jgi:hypothetical protein